MTGSPAVAVIKECPPKRTKEWQRARSWTSWFRILPGKGEHEGTTTAWSQTTRSKEVRPIPKSNRAVNFLESHQPEAARIKQKWDSKECSMLSTGT